MTKSPWWQPRWTRPFIEEPEISQEGEDIESSKSRTPWTAFVILLLLAGSLIAEVAVFLHQRTRIGVALIAVSGFSLFWTVLFRPRTGSAVLSLATTAALALQTVVSISQWKSNPSDIPDHVGIVNVAVSAILLVILLNMSLRPPWLSRASISKPFTTPTSDLRSPEDNLTLWQWMTVSWVSPLMAIGSKRQLEDSDVWNLAYEFQHTHLHNTFRELKGSVIRRLLRANWIDLVILSSLACVELGARYASPLILQKLLQAMPHVQYDKQSALKWGALIFFVEFLNAQSGVFSLWYGRRCYERSRGEMVTMIYEKTLHRKIVSGVKQTDGDAKDNANGEESHANGNGSKANGHGNGDDANGHSETTPLLGAKPKTEKRQTMFSWLLQPVTTVVQYLWGRKEPEKPDEKGPAQMGKILNIMRNDVYEIAQRFWEAQTIVKKPIGLALSIVFVWQIMGPACLLGIAVLVVSQFLSVLVARIMRNRERARRKKTDTRLQETSQYVETIRHLRYYGWHETWLKRIMASRQTELNWKIITNLWGIALGIVNALGSDMMVFATFLGYTALLHKELRIDVSFPALQLLYMLQSEIRGLPDLIVVFLNAQVALRRIEEFMDEPDKDENEKTGSTPADGGMLALKNATFAWPGSDSSVLRNVTLSFPVGLHVISGPVASGKSALLKALLGELDLQSGELLTHNGPVGYCAQNPWLQSMSIRDNILFTSEYDEERYKKTIDACALTPDFADFKDGDRSAIGENGIGLSGGQKARVALARAVYSHAQVLLLDDPLSALDQQTAEIIVEKCLRSDLVETRTVILVTHRLDLVRGIAEQRILLAQGVATVNEEEGQDEKAVALQVATQSTDGKVERTVTQEPAMEQKVKKFEDEEERQQGSVKLAVYWEYVKAGGFWNWLLLIVALSVCRIFVLAEPWYIKEWGEAYGESQPLLYLRSIPEDLRSFAGRSPLDRLFDAWPSPLVNIYPWLLGLFFILVMQSVGVVGIRGSMMVVTYSASKTMFTEVMKMVSNATFHFYDVTPVGRLMNRLTSDIGTLDGHIAHNFFQITWSATSWITSIIIIASVTPLFLIVSIGLTIVFVLVFMRFLPTSQSLRRLEMASLSPLMSNFGALLEGLMTVRAFCAQSQFQEKVIGVVDTFQKMDHMYWQVQGWLSYRFDIISASSTFILTAVAIYSGVSPGLTAFVLVTASRFVGATHGLCRLYGALQLDFVSVERVVELLHVPQESKGTIKPPKTWPAYHTDIAFENVTIRYAPHLEPALSKVTCTVPGGTTTAVTGRTGSGKSTLALSLLGTLEPEEGRILIDGISTMDIDKQALRSRITFLAQEPVLFPGTLQKNLDPLEEHTAAECEAVLARISTASNATSTLVDGRPWTLTTQVDTGGKNLSHGQRQLVGLARAILRRSAIVVMDEATASIDQETAWEVQRLLREELVDSTVVTIAHRAEAVHGVRNCLVLAKGKVIKQGDPAALKNTGGDTGDGADDVGSGTATGVATPAEPVESEQHIQ